MRVLLDTHIVLWALSSPEKLGDIARQIIVEETNLILVSAVTSWEIAIKKSLGKLKAPDNFLAELDLKRFDLMDISHQHAVQTEQLPYHHQDPFDRLLIAQAQIEGLPILSHDRIFKQYDVEVISNV